MAEPHQSYILSRLPEVLDLLTSNLDCAFLEFSQDIEQKEFIQLAEGKNTNYFQSQESMQYIPIIKKLLAEGIKIIPVDDPVVRTQRKNKNALDWMIKRDQTMFDNITEHMKSCKKAIFLVGKSHITPALSGYDNSLGMMLKGELKEGVAIIDLTVPRNFSEPYCSFKENNLFEDKVFMPTKDLNSEYSLQVSNSFWSDFDWALYLPEYKNHKSTSL